MLQPTCSGTFVLDAPTLDTGPARCTATALTLAIPVGTSLADVDRKLIYATLELCGGVPGGKATNSRSSNSLACSVSPQP